MHVHFVCLSNVNPTKRKHEMRCNLFILCAQQLSLYLQKANALMEFNKFAKVHYKHSRNVYKYSSLICE